MNAWDSIYLLAILIGYVLLFHIEDWFYLVWVLACSVLPVVVLLMKEEVAAT
jgi:hypothetical protein